jgi:2-aminoadipate transaminase
MEPLLHLKGSHDFGSTNLVQHLIAELIASGAYSRHIELLQGVYRRKRDRMLQAFHDDFSDVPGAEWTVPAGGLYVWLTLDGIDTGPQGPLVPAALESGVLFVPGEFGHVPDELGRVPTNECRICFGVATEEEITEGIHRLRAAVSVVMDEKRRGQRVITEAR